MLHLFPDALIFLDALNIVLLRMTQKSLVFRDLFAWIFEFELHSRFHCSAILSREKNFRRIANPLSLPLYITKAATFSRIGDTILFIVQ